MRNDGWLLKLSHEKQEISKQIIKLVYELFGISQNILGLAAIQLN